MPTFNQLVKKGRQTSVKKSTAPALQKGFNSLKKKPTDTASPQKRGVCTCLLYTSMYGEKGKEAKAREYKHMTFYEAANLAKQADVKEMWLTHYSPSLVRAEEFMDDVRKIFPYAKAGKDRKYMEIDFEEE